MAKSDRTWRFDDKERRILVDATGDLPELQAVVERAARRPELNGLWVVHATVDELDEIYTLVETMMNATRSEARLEVLEEMIGGLCAAMDGF